MMRCPRCQSTDIWECKDWWICRNCQYARQEASAFYVPDKPEWWDLAGITREQAVDLQKLAQKLSIQGTPCTANDLLAFINTDLKINTVTRLSHIKRPNPIRVFFERWYIRIRSLIIYPWWKRCDYACGWMWPYGYVPEAGCPVHDPEAQCPSS